MTKPKQLSHIVLHTGDVPRMVAWYSKTLEAHPTLDDSPRLVFLSYDDEHHRIGLMHIDIAAGQRPLAAPGMAHVAFTFASAGELMDKYEELKAAGVSPAFTIHHGGTLSAYYHDPDGNVVELFADVFQTPAEAHAFMESPQFRENPIGKPVDFDDLLARAKAGASERELLRYPEEKTDPRAMMGELSAALAPP